MNPSTTSTISTTSTNQHDAEQAPTITHNHARVSDQPKHLALTKTIYCQRSGVPLVEVTSVCTNGWALLSQPIFTVFVHPVYQLPLGKAIRKLELQLIEAEKQEWLVGAAMIKEMGLSMSSIMYSLGTMWTPNDDQLNNGKNIESSLPDAKIVIGSAARLLTLAGWYHFQTTKRLNFPLWKPSKQAGNLNWHGFPAWLDACYEIKSEWESAKRKAENKALLKATSEALLEVSVAYVYKRIDVSKVWNWIDLQAKENQTKYPAGRRETLKSLFMTGDLSPEDWMADDCDDLIEMVIDCCDLGNDITSYIRNRVSNIRASIADFYGNFTLIGNVSTAKGDGFELTDKEQVAQDGLFTEYETKMDSMGTLPPKPSAADYPNKIMLLRATAEWNILSRLFEARAKRVDHNKDQSAI